MCKAIGTLNTINSHSHDTLHLLSFHYNLIEIAMYYIMVRIHKNMVGLHNVLILLHENHTEMHKVS